MSYKRYIFGHSDSQNPFFRYIWSSMFLKTLQSRSGEMDVLLLTNMTFGLHLRKGAGARWTDHVIEGWNL